MERIGERIKRKREQQSLQLNDLAKRVGISPSALSQIERAKSFPSILTLKQIALCLKTTVGELIGENEPVVNNPLFRKEENILICDNDTQAEMYLLSQHNANNQLDSFLMRFQLNANSTDLFKTVSGFMFGYLLKGELQFEIDNVSYVVQEGDSVYFNTKRNFQFKNTHTGVSELLCVLPNNHHK